MRNKRKITIETSKLPDDVYNEALYIGIREAIRQEKEAEKGRKAALKGWRTRRRKHK